MQDEELEEFFNNWLDTIQTVFGEVLEEWDENNYVQTIENATTEFHCNDCGKCCNFQKHDVWVYPFDMVRWLQKWSEHKDIPLYLSALLPVQDIDGVIGVGLPSQRNLYKTYQQLLKKKKGKQNKKIRNTLYRILDLVKEINPNFDKSSEFCIYYNPNPEKKNGHCQIYPYRPIQCQAYPYDYPCFTKIDIPQIEKEESMNILPMCPPETYSNGKAEEGIKITEKERQSVLLEKANYRTSTAIKNWADESADWKEFTDINILDVILELFHSEIMFLTRKQKSTQETKEGKVVNKKYVSGKRPNKK